MKISDYKVAEHFVRTICKRFGAPFVDVPIRFEQIQGVGEATQYKHVLEYSDGAITVVVGPNSTLVSTISQIVSAYAQRLSDITGSNVSLSDPEKIQLLKNTIAVAKDFCQSPNSLPEAQPNSGLSTSLRYFPFVWILLRDLIVPFYQTTLDDVTVLIGRSAQVDAARYLTSEDDVDLPDGSVPCIFVNNEVESQTYRSAFIFVEALRAHDLDPSKVISDIMTHPDLTKTVFGYVKMALVVEKEVEDFFLSLEALAGHPFTDPMTDGFESSVWRKEAQATMTTQTGWFAPMLYEALLEDVRGNDFSATNRLEPLRTELWNRIEEERKRRGKLQMTLEDMLRVHSRGQKVDSKLTLQGLLADERIW